MKKIKAAVCHCGKSAFSVNVDFQNEITSSEFKRFEEDGDTIIIEDLEEFKKRKCVSTCKKCKI